MGIGYFRALPAAKAFIQPRLEKITIGAFGTAAYGTAAVESGSSEGRVEGRVGKLHISSGLRG